MGFSIRTYKWYNSGHNCTMPIDTENKLDPQVPRARMRARLDAGARHPRACTHSRLCCSGRSFPWIPMDFFAPKWIDPKLMPKLMPILVTSWWFGTCFFLSLSICWECHHPNWLTFIFFRGVGLNHQAVNIQTHLISAVAFGISPDAGAGDSLPRDQVPHGSTLFPPSSLISYLFSILRHYCCEAWSESQSRFA